MYDSRWFCARKFGVSLWGKNSDWETAKQLDLRRWRERTEFQNKEFSIVTSYLFGWRGQQGYRGTSWGAVNPATKRLSVSIPTRDEKHFAFADYHASTKCTTVLHTCLAVTKSAACICDAFRARLNTLFVQSVQSITQHTRFQLHTFVFTPTLLQHYILFCEEVVSSVTSGFRRSVNESALFWDVTQRILAIADVSEPIGSIFKGQVVEDECLYSPPVFCAHFSPSIPFFSSFSL